jgi:hypothetical protein
VTTGGFTSLLLVLDQFYLSAAVTPKTINCHLAATIPSILDNQPLLLSEIILKLVAMLPIS